MNKDDIKLLVTNILVVGIAAGLAIAGSIGGVTIFGWLPLFALAVIIAFLMQWIVYIPSFIRKTEKYYDLTGSLTYTTVIILTTVLSSNFNVRKILIMILVLIWAFRLGIFLFRRILKAGEDKRFEQMKQSGLSFLRAWNTQGLWVSFTLAAALASITADQMQTSDFNALDWVCLAIGLLIWLVGFTFEAVADQQKSNFNSKSENQGRFINVGLWSISRHPNYFGEITIWIGMAIITLPTLQGWRWIGLISPFFVILLLTSISGVPLLEKRSDKKWGEQPDYERYKRDTPVLIPKISFKKGN